MSALPDLPSVYLLVPHLAVLAGLAWLLRLKTAGKPQLAIHFWPAFLIKALAGVAVGLVYGLHYKGGDTFLLYQDALTLSRLLGDDPLLFLRFLADSGADNGKVLAGIAEPTPRALFFSKTVSLVLFFTGNNYWLAGCYFSLTAFTGTWLLLVRLVGLAPHLSLCAVLGFLYWPSFVFWSSGILKESLMVGCLGTVAYALGILQTHRRHKYWLPALIAGLLYVVLRLKYYYLAAFVPALAAFYAARWVSARYSQRHAPVLAGLGVFACTLLAASATHPNLYPKAFFSAVVENSEKMAQQTEKKGNLIVYHKLSPNAWGLSRNIPKAVWEGFARPYLWEKGNWLKKAAAAEALLSVLLLLTALQQAVFGKHKAWHSVWYREHVPLLFATCLYVALLAVLLPLAAPNLGNLVRYKAGYMPLLATALLWLAFPSWMKLPKTA